MIVLSDTSSPRRGRLAAVAAVALVGGILGASPAGLAAPPPPASPAGQTLRVSTDPGRTEAGRIALSDNGLVAAYQSRVFVADEPESAQGQWQVLTRALPAGTPKLASIELPDGVDATNPSLSGDAGRVAYVVERNETRTIPPPDPGSGVELRTSGDNELQVGDQRITNTVADRTWQRTLKCDNTDEGTCGPQLSGDGRTVVFPALDSIASPYLVPEMPAGEGPDALLMARSTGQYLPLFDFGGPFTLNSFVSLTIVVRIFSDIAFAGELPATDSAVFEVVPNNTVEDSTRDCTGAFTAGSVCHITVQYAPPADHLCSQPQTDYATLHTNAPTPAGRTALALVAEGCHQTPVPIKLRSGPVRAAPPLAAAAPALPPAPCTARPNPVSGIGNLDAGLLGGAQVGVFGELPLRTVGYRRYTVINQDDGQRTVTFTSPDCAMTLDESVPDGQDEGIPTCRRGTLLAGGGACNAYLRFEPQAVQPYASTLILTDNGVIRQTARFSGSGADHVVLTRRDTAGNGTFADPTVVSVPEAGTSAVNGTQPSVSNDGRRVAFASLCAPAANLTLPNAATLDCSGGPQHIRQAYVRDTQAGTTRQVSLLPTGKPAASAHEPSLSGDGSRVAFGTLAEPGGPDVGLPLSRVDQVYVRDLTADRTILASTRPDLPAAPDEPGSHHPKLSRDGSTVAFASRRGDPVGEFFHHRVLVRDLGPDFGGPGEPGNEQASVGIVDGAPEDGDLSHNSAIDADGGVIGFDSQEPLTDEPVVAEGFGAFVRARFPHPVAIPPRVTFPALPARAVGAKQIVTVTNGGPGPVHVSAATVVGPYQVVSTTCDRVLHRAESCTVGVTTAPTEPGTQSGTLTVPGAASLAPPATVRIPLSGRATLPLITVRPTPVTFPAQALGTTSAPTAVRITNISTVPLTVRAAYNPKTAEFAVPRTTCGTLAPKATCTVDTTFTPAGPGRRTGSLVLTVTNPGRGIAFSQAVPATGPTVVPTLTIGPLVVVAGRVAVVTGDHFMPGRTVTLTWRPGAGSVTVTPDGTGHFATQMIVFSRDILGGRNPVGTTAGIPPVLGPPILVVLGSAQPPDFTTRH